MSRKKAREGIGEENLGMVFRLSQCIPDSYDNEAWIFDITDSSALPMRITSREGGSVKISVWCDPDRYFIVRPKMLGELFSEIEQERLREGRGFSPGAYERVVERYEEMKRAREGR